MRKSIGFLLVLVALAPAALAQSFPRVTYSGGLAASRQEPNFGTFYVTEDGETFSFKPCVSEGAGILGSSLQGALCGDRSFRGFEGSVQYNIARMWGVRTDFMMLTDEARSVDTFGDGADAHTDTNVIKDRTYLLTTGIEWGDNARVAKWRPFVHVMAGLARQTSRDRQTSTGPFNFTLHDSARSIALKIGAGIDVPLSHRVDIRLIEVNYTPVFARARNTPGDADFEQRVNGKTAQNITFSAGIVWH
jgi:opacity protein-like surface antigen